MHKYNILFNSGVLFFLVFAIACSPLKEKVKPAPLVEMEFVDPDLVSQFSDKPDHLVSGNLSLEVQQDISTGKSNVYASASFHEPTRKNVLFDKVRTGILSQHEYKPKPPVDQPCGIPGFPDCAGAPPTAPVSSDPTGPIAKPDDPCGIPGFPDCPKVIEAIFLI